MNSNQNYCVLVVDDIIDNLLLLQFMLETEGYQVKLASSGSAAIATVQTSPPDLVLLDIMMPDMSGFEVTHHLRQLENLLMLPIVLVTAAQEIDLKQALAVGATDIIHKPIDMEELLTRISIWCPVRSPG